ncbi:MAG: Cardiolipin synthetase [Devosia sp.]|nr:Cardiolipin synthetase [Devosia sp.]
MILHLFGWLESLVPDQTLLGWFIFLNFLLALGCAVREIFNSRTSQGSIAWLLSLLLLPFPTTVLYLVFGLKLFDDYSAIQRIDQRDARQLRRAEMSLLDNPESDNWPVLARVSQIPFIAGNATELLIDGQATFDSIFAGIDRAQHSIFVQFYIFRDDELGKALAARLIARAEAGVVIQLLYDDVGCFTLNKQYFRRLRAAGIKVSSFNHRHRILRVFGPTRINYRCHRKIVVVDGQEAWVGGLNVGDEYMGRSKRFGHWRDTHVHLNGPAALACTLSFCEDWQWATGEELQPFIPEMIEAPGTESVLVMPTGPADVLEDCAIAFTDVISRARKRLWIVSPYFVPDAEIQIALYAAAMRGVDVRLLIPAKPDHIVVWLASIAHASSMIDHGVAVFRYTAGFLHQKIILVDDEVAGVGTVNFDNRSFRINFEVTLWFTGIEMIKAVEAMLEEDFRYSKRLTLDERERLSWGMKFLGQAARLFSPVL